jgi:hypothetical protein
MCSHIVCYNLYFINVDVMVSVLSSSAVGRVFEAPSGHAKAYEKAVSMDCQF